MQKFKKFMAVALAATMVIGSSVTVFAAETTSGGTDGTGTSEGHVDKKTINVILPTVPDGSTPFNYTMDPERLIQGTSAAKYEKGSTFPAKENDTGVYFLTAPKTYANTSNTLQAINKSSCDITLTVKVKAEASAGGKDITLAENATPSTTAAELYLGLKVGDDTTTVSATEVTVTKTIPGTPANYEVAVKDGAYVYQPKADASTWKAININVTGAVSAYAIAADTTAPKLIVTWEYAEAANGAIAATDVVDYSEGPAASGSLSTSNLSVSISGLADGATLKSAVVNKVDGTNNVAMTSGSHYSFNATTGTLTILKANLVDATTIKEWVLTFSDNTTVKISVVAAP